MIEYKWAEGQQNHIISKIWLKYDRLDKVYAHLARRPKWETVDHVLSRLFDIKSQTKNIDWALSWLDESIEAIAKKRALGTSLPADRSEREDLFTVILYLVERDEADDIETTERIFSMKCLGDSKRFELTVKKRLTRILKAHLFKGDIKDDCSDEEALRAIGIVRYPERFEFAGSLSIALPAGVVDYAPLPNGGSLSAVEVRLGRISIGQDVSRVISIENRTNYIEYIQKRQNKETELIIYHGGQFSPAKKIFLQSVASAMPKGCEFYHWGDIDYGGFIMLARLRREISCKIKGWKMDVESLSRHIEFATGYKDSYRKRLESLLGIPELTDCAPCVDFMLKNNIRLEQEAMLIF
jgi:hypothetical protein